MRWDFLVLSLATFAASLVLGNVQWMLLLRLQDIHLSFRKALSFYFVGAFFNNFLPTRFGGDIVRIWDGSRYSRSVLKSSAMSRWAVW